MNQAVVSPHLCTVLDRTANSGGAGGGAGAAGVVVLVVLVVVVVVVVLVVVVVVVVVVELAIQTVCRLVGGLIGSCCFASRL